MTVRKMTEEDIASVVTVDSKAFSDAWGETSFYEEIGKDYSHYFVCESDGEIAGYAGIWCIYETAELIRIATTPKFQKRGIANMLMQEILGCAKENGCERMMLEVRRSNAPAQALYKKFGFGEISVRKGYYNGEDASIMESKL
ncbi:MAG: ribosomal protein S18-alanine N-acetyltransferase [Clostridia bacterium]|nr:ribosomal protein S18-alanine N-acetyltransferase [Clostridia bacterium]